MLSEMCTKFRTTFLPLTKADLQVMNVKFYLDKPKASHEIALYLYVRSGKKTLKFNTGRLVHPNHWDKNAQKVLKSHGNSIKFNLRLKILQTEVWKAIDDLASKGATSLEDARDVIAAIVEKGSYQEEKVSLPEAYKLFLDVYEASRSTASVKKYKTILNHLNAYAIHKRIRLTFETFDLSFQEDFVAYLIKHANLTNNTIARKIKFIKTFLNWATERGYNNKLDFKKFGQKEEQVDIITLTQNELTTLFNLDLSKNPKLEQVRDVFCFGCYTGQRFSDIAALQPEHIKGNRWHLHTQKTKDNITVILIKEALEILTKYTKNGKKLPTISNQKTNTYLKELGKIAGIDDTITIRRYQGAKKIQRTEPKYNLITTHAARRTFITISMEKNIPHEIIRKMSGHKDYRSFQKYVNADPRVVEEIITKAWNN